MAHFVPPEIFRKIVEHAPLVSVDLVLCDPDGHVLVGLRTNEPARGVYFVPGGVIRKDETLDDAFARILMTETGQVGSRVTAQFLGPYQHFYDTNRFFDPGYGTHYIVLAYRVRLPVRPHIRLDDQHETIRWMTPEAILAASDVHENTKAYFRQGLSPRFAARRR